MSHSEDEDDFLSADEDVGAEEPERQAVKSKVPVKQTIATKKSSNTKVISDIEKKPKIESSSSSSSSGSESGDVDDIKVKSEEPNKEESTQKQATQEDVRINPSRQVEGVSKDYVADKDDEKDEDDDDDDEEEALAERIRERNLKIARNFSVEIAKNLRASAPIPVKTPSPSSRVDESGNTPSSSHNKSAHLPPAPPPTPALSSSFNNLSEQTSSQQATLGTSPSQSTQYSWRIPPKNVATPTTPTISHAQRTNDTSAPSSSSESKTSEQARQALDRLSQKVSQPERNLFERVAADIKNMSIKGDDTINPVDVTSQLAANLPSTITGLGSTLGSWGWSGATSLLSSATQVTSQVGSVITSVAQQLEPTYQLHDEQSLKSKKNAKSD